MKTAIIRQPAGLGDILYTYKIAKKIIELGKADLVYWPVVSQYNYLNNYLENDKIVFVDEKNDFPFKSVYEQDPYKIVNTDELLYIPLQRADSIIPLNTQISNHPMYCKYELVGLSFNDWSSYLDIKRDLLRETKIKEYLNLPADYIVVNKTFGTFPNTVIAKTVPEIKNAVEIKNLSFDNPFDWCDVFLNAKEIHTVDTSFCYIIAFLNITNVTIYSRNWVTDFKYNDKIFPKEWKFISL